MSIDLITLIIFILGLSFWTGVLNNKVNNLETRLKDNDEMTKQIPTLAANMTALLSTLNDIKSDLHEIKNDMTQMKIDIEGLKKDVC